MAKDPDWTENEIMLLGNLIEAGFTNKEIAVMMNRKYSGVAIKTNRVYGSNPNYRKKITKYAHLREPVMLYYLTHTAEECQKKFKLTPSEFKSLLTASYRRPELKHLRKETRVRSPWTTKQYLTLIQNAGIRPRDYIAKKLKRGNVQSCIKERFERLGVASRTLNGMTLSSYRLLFGKEPRKYLLTDAGPGRGKYSPTYFKLIPWVQVNKDIKDKYVSTTKPMRLAIEARAMFQEWIFQGEYKKKIERRLTNGQTA